jgi:hypothetical protein
MPICNIGTELRCRNNCCLNTEYLYFALQKKKQTMKKNYDGDNNNDNVDIKVQKRYVHDTLDNTCYRVIYEQQLYLVAMSVRVFPFGTIVGKTKAIN